MFEIIWSRTASQNLRQILVFWTENNKSGSYAEKIVAEIIKTEELLKLNPLLGASTSFQEVRRILILHNFSIFYDCDRQKKLIKIVAFRDNRRIPKF